MDYQHRLSLLEQKHIEYQMNAFMHLRVHFEMLRLAVRYRVWREVLGQIPRIILAVPGSLLNIAPVGNVGSTKMGIFEKVD